MCQIDVLYGKSLIIDFLDNFLKKRTAIGSIPPVLPPQSCTFAPNSEYADYLIKKVVSKGLIIYPRLIILPFSLQP